MNNLIPALLSIALLTACVSPTQEKSPRTQNSQTKTNNFRSRAFETSDRNLILRGIISTMQDLNFRVEKIDETLGTISGIQSNTSFNVSISQMGQNRIVVVLNAFTGMREITDVLTYNNFFRALAETLALQAHLID